MKAWIIILYGGGKHSPWPEPSGERNERAAARSLSYQRLFPAHPLLRGTSPQRLC
jgi:hypothetical protein